VKFHNNVSVVAGIRGDFSNDFAHTFTPKISIMYPFEKFILRGTYAAGFRTPGIKERYYNFDLGFISVVGNKNLVPEYSHYFSISAELASTKGSTSLNLYTNQLRDMIYEKKIADDENAYTYENISRVAVWGIDLINRRQVLSNLFISCGYSFTYAHDLSTDRDLYGVSRHSANASISYRLRLSKSDHYITFSSRYYSKKYYEMYNEQYVFYVENYPAYSLSKLSVSDEICESSVRLNYGIQNLFNYKKETDMINIDPGRRFFVSLQIKCEQLYEYFKK